nr:hypothetical protein [Tanacetum cinerariifolium]
MSQEDINLKFLRSLPPEWKTHTLIWRNKTNLEEHNLDDLFNSLGIYEAEVKHSSSPRNPTQNIAFVSSSNTDSTTDSVSAATSVSAVCAQLPVSSHPNIDSLSNAVIFSFFASKSTSPQLDNEDLKQIYVDDLEEMDLRWQMAMLTMRARRFLQKTGRNLGNNRVTTIAELIASQTNNKHGLGYLPSEDVYANLSLSCPSDRVQPSGGYNDVSTAKPAQVMSHITESMAPIIEDWVSDSEDESEPNDPKSAPSFVQSSEKVKPSGHFAQLVEEPILDHTPKTTSSKNNGSRKRKNRKTCFVCKGVDHLIKDCTFHVKPKAQPTPRNYAHRGYDKQYASSTKKYPQKHRVPATVFTKSKPVSVTPARPVVSTAKGKKGKWAWMPKHQIPDHDSSASKLLKQLNQKDALRRSKSVKAWIPKRI